MSDAAMRSARAVAARRVHELAVAVSSDGVRVPISRARTADLARAVLAAERVRDAMLSIAFVTSAAMVRLNREHLAHAGPTDVISFGLGGSPGGPVVGDLYICPAVARENAAAHGATVREELARLVVHGTLHIVGHDHEDGDGRSDGPMWRRQERLLATLRPAWGG